MDRFPERLSMKPTAAMSTSLDQTSRASGRGWVVLLVLLVLAGAIAALRLHTFHEPIERDLITYMMVGHAMNKGGWTYIDGWEIKPPGVYALYALAEWAAGFGEPEIYALTVVASIATLIGVYVAGSARGGRASGLWAAVFWVLISGAPTLEANQPNTEVFINACVIGALALLVQAGNSTSRGIGRAIAVGLLFAAATTFKQIIVIDAFVLSVAHIAFAGDLPGGRRRALRDVAIFAVVGALCWFSMIAFFAATGRFEIFWLTNFANARAYAGNPLFNFYRYVREAHVFPRILWFLAPLIGLIMLGALRDRRMLTSRLWGLYLATLFAVQIKIPTNGASFLAHYYQYWLPLLAIGGGWAAGVRTPRLRLLPSWTMPVAGAVVALFLTGYQAYYLTLPADEWSRLKYGDVVLDGRDIGRTIGTLLQPEERLYQHGYHPEYYFYSGHDPSMRVALWSQHLSDNWPTADLLIKPHIAALKAAKPDLITVDTPTKPARSSEPETPGLIWRLLVGKLSVNEGRHAQSVLDTLLSDYRTVEIPDLERYHDVQFYVLRSSPLDHRLSGGKP
jgi:hypothetical protein